MPLISGTAGASRMSSVRLEREPPDRDPLPLQGAEMLLEPIEQAQLLVSLTASTAWRILKSFFSALANWSIALTSFGKQLPP